MTSTEEKEFTTLMNTIGVELNNKDVQIVISVLATQLATAGVTCGVPLEDLLKYVTMTLMFHYFENSPNDSPVH